ncbi:hypothetical protein STENM327S_00583 [Streptomyces tendae]
MRCARGGPGDQAATGAAPTELFGRREETAVLDGLLTQARGGSGGALVVWGEPGIGKSALLRHVHGQAADFVRLSHSATRPESDLAFAGLHGLLRPLADRVELLATAQAAAVRTALGLSGEPTDRLVVGAAVLSLLRGLAERQPVLVVVDDGQWLDEATALCLGFVARRVGAHPVVVVLADHSDPAARPWEGVADVRVDGLSDESARQLVAAVAPLTDEATTRSMVREAGGNPLALHELATLGGDLDDAEHRRKRGRPPVGPCLQRAFRARIEALSPPAQLLTVLAAAEEHGDRLTVQRAGRASGAGDAVWEEVTNAGLLHVAGNRVGFRHPVVSRAVYEGCGAATRRRAHRALAATMPDEAEERAWHLAALAHGRDEDVARLLERTAVRSRLRGATNTAARAWWRAAELSAAPIDASQRLAEAARASWDAGWAATAERLLDDADRLAPGAHVARRSRGLRGIMEFARGMPEMAHHFLITDMKRVPEPGTALELGTLAMRAAWSVGRGDLRDRALELLLEEDVAGRSGLPGTLAWWSDDVSADAAPADTPDLGDPAARARTTILPLLPPTPLALAWGIDKPMADALRRRLPHLRRRSEHARLAAFLAQTAMLDNAAGRWPQSESSAAEGLRLAQDLGADHIASHCLTSLSWLAAARGDERAVAEATARTLETSLPQGVRALSAAAYWNRGMALLFRERPEEALDILVRLTEPGHGAEHPTFGSWPLSTRPRRPCASAEATSRTNGYGCSKPGRGARERRGPAVPRTSRAGSSAAPGPRVPSEPPSTCRLPDPTRCSTRALSWPTASGCDGAAGGPMRASGSAPPWRRSTGSVPSRCANARSASRTSPEGAGTPGKLGHQGDEPAHRPGTASRRTGRRTADESRDRRPAADQPPHRGPPPRERVRQARHQHPNRAERPPRRL